MHDILQWTEENAYRYNRGSVPKEGDRTFITDSICYSACKLATDVKATAIIAFTTSGYTTYRLSGNRPNAKIYTFTNNRGLISKLSLLWGVKAFDFDLNEAIENAIGQTINILLKKNEIQRGDIVIHVGNTLQNKKERTNILKITYV